MSNCLPPGERTLISDRRSGRLRATTERTPRKRASILAMVYWRIVPQAPLCCGFRLWTNGARELWGDRVLILGIVHPLCWEAGRTIGGPDPKAASHDNQLTLAGSRRTRPTPISGRPVHQPAAVQIENVRENVRENVTYF